MRMKEQLRDRQRKRISRLKEREKYTANEKYETKKGRRRKNILYLNSL
jgi:hypothetical protein